MILFSGIPSIPKYFFRPFQFLQIFILSALTGIFVVTSLGQTAKREIYCHLALDDRMLEVKMAIPASKQAKTEFKVSDWAGVDNYADNIYRVRATDAGGNNLALEKTDERTWTVTGSGRPFTLSYEVVSQKESFMGSNSRGQFQPTLFRDYAFLWGATFLLHPTADELAELPVNLKITPGSYRISYSNFEGRVKSFNEFSDLFLAAGNYRAERRVIAGRRVQFIIQGDKWKFTDKQFIDTVSKIIAAQVGYMGFYPADKENLLVTLTEGTPTSAGGTVVKNVISIYPDAQLPLDDPITLGLITHEHFHVWNNDYLKDAGDKQEGYYKWMSEGFTEYYSLLTLYREGIIDAESYTGQINQTLLKYQRNPAAFSATSQMLAENYWKSRDYNRLPYQKGAVVALLFDLQIRKQTSSRKNIDDFMRLLIKKAVPLKGYTDKIVLETLNEVTGTDNQRFFDDHVTGAKLLPVVETLAASNLSAKETRLEVFDQGFSTVSGRIERNAIVKEVAADSNAARAGLLPGDELQGYSLNFGDPQTEAEFNIKRGAKFIDLKYYPRRTQDIIQIDPQTVLPK